MEINNDSIKSDHTEKRDLTKSVFDASTVLAVFSALSYGLVSKLIPELSIYPEITFGASTLTALVSGTRLYFQNKASRVVKKNTWEK